MAGPPKPIVLDSSKFLEPKDWHHHQDTTVTHGGAPYIRNYTKLLLLPKYRALTFAQRGVLHSIWLYCGGTGLRLSQDAARATLSLSQTHTRHTLGHLKVLIRAGFLVMRTHQNIQEKKRIDNTPSKRARRGRLPDLPDPEGFVRWWAVYPKKVGKMAALAAWRKHKAEPMADQIIKATRRQSKSDAWAADGGQYIPHPTTWLNQGRWDDEVDRVETDAGSERSDAETRKLAAEYFRDAGRAGPKPAKI